MALQRAIVRRGALALAALAFAACTESSLYDPKDPWSDPFFDDGYRSKELDKVWEENAPSVGWLANPDHKSAHPPDSLMADQDKDEPVRPGHENELLGAEPAGGGSDEADAGDDDDGRPPQRSFSERAQEATLATLSVLVGAGMAALPYLVGT